MALRSFSCFWRSAISVTTFLYKTWKTVCPPLRDSEVLLKKDSSGVRGRRYMQSYLGHPGEGCEGSDGGFIYLLPMEGRATAQSRIRIDPNKGPSPRMEALGKISRKDFMWGITPIWVCAWWSVPSWSKTKGVCTEARVTLMVPVVPALIAVRFFCPQVLFLCRSQYSPLGTWYFISSFRHVLCCYAPYLDKWYQYSSLWAAELISGLTGFPCNLP